MKNIISFIIALLLVGVIFGFSFGGDDKSSSSTEKTSLTITEPGNYDVANYDEIIVDIETSTEVNLQDKTVTPGESSQTIIPDLNYDGLGSVTVNPIPSDYIKPDGSIDIVENGTYDVTNFKSVNVNIPTSSYEEWDGSYEEINNTAVAQSETIPEGYRLLTGDDVGKTFGVDLESMIYIDTSISPDTNTSASDCMLLVTFEDVSDEFYIDDPNDFGIEIIKFVNSENTYTLYNGSSGSWDTDNIEIVNNLTLNYTIKEVYFGGSYSGYDVPANTWFYVKDKTSDPYSITITNEDGIKLLTSDKLCSDDITIKIDESLFASEIEPPYTSLIKNTGDGDLYIYIPNENGVLESITISAYESLTVKHFGLINWKWSLINSYSWDGITFYTSTNGDYYFIQTGDTANIYTLEINIAGIS